MQSSLSEPTSQGFAGFGSYGKSTLKKSATSTNQALFGGVFRFR